MIKHFSYFLSYKRYGPFKKIHKVRQQIRMLGLQKLLNIQRIIFEFYHGAFIVIKVTIVWGWKYCYDCWKLLCTTPMVHFKTVGLGFMCPDHRKQTVLLKKSFRKLISKIVRTSSCIIFLRNRLHLSCIIINWISPHQIAKSSTFRDLLKSVNFFNIFNVFNIGRNPTVNA